MNDQPTFREALDAMGWVTDTWAEKVRSLAITEFLAGETPGPLTVTEHMPSGIHVVCTLDGKRSPFFSASEAEARAVANTLNYLEAHRG